MKKRILSFILIILIALGLMPTLSFAETTASGQCGDSATWTYDRQSGTLTIEGTGAISDYKFTTSNNEETVNSPWFAYKHWIYKIIIGEGITAIGNHAFRGIVNCIELSLPTTLTEIGASAFNGCNFEAIQIPDGVTSIGERAFANCKRLKTITIPDNVTSIGEAAFYNCTALYYIKLSNKLEKISEYMFWNCTSLSSITVPPSVKVIESCIFYDAYGIDINITDIKAWCAIDFEFTDLSLDYRGHPFWVDGTLYYNGELLTHLVIPDGVETINEFAFFCCRDIKEVTLPYTLNKISNDAFLGCESLEYINIPDSVKSIGRAAFQGCVSLKSINIPENSAVNSYSFAYTSSLKRFAFPKGNTRVPDKVLYDSGVTTIYLPKTINITYDSLRYPNIQYVYYEGTEQDRALIKELGSQLENATWIYNADGLPEHKYVNNYDDQCLVCGEIRRVPNDLSGVFKDVKSNAWYKYYVDYAVSFGIFTGTSNNTFSPNDNITRAQFVQVLANVQGVDTSNRNVKTQFSDVPAKKWYTAAVKWASENKIVNGIGGGKFDPNANVTREQMCLMLVNFAKFKSITLKSVEAKESFTDDAKISKWAKTAVYTCQQADIVNGKGGGKFDPQGTGTRAEASVIFTKFHKDYLAK